MSGSKNLELTLENLSPEQQLETLDLLNRLKAINEEESYFEFFKSAWKIIEPAEHLVLSPHIEYLCNVLDYHIKRLAEGQLPKYEEIIINVPPGSSKSSIITKILPAWVWLQNESMRIITASYSSTLAIDHTIKTRDIITSEWYQENWGDKFRLKKDQNVKSWYQNDAGGMRFATSTGGTLTGFHAHLFISDDPINPQQADSEVKRKSAIKFWDTTVPSRIIGNGFKILVMQRSTT